MSTLALGIPATVDCTPLVVELPQFVTPPLHQSGHTHNIGDLPEPCPGKPYHLGPLVCHHASIIRFLKI
jgi:hypothetical protein